MKVFKRTIKISKLKRNIYFIVLFLIIINSIFLFNIYAKSIKEDTVVLIQNKLDKVIYQFFSDLITDKVISKEKVDDLLSIDKNKQGEILSVRYNLEKTYQVLTEVSSILKTGLSNLENGSIDVSIYDKYLENSKNGLILNIPLFLSSENIFLNNIGPRIPVIINFNSTLLTNIKTKVTNYGLNNALLEIYVTVEIKKIIITPFCNNEDSFHYDILIGALVVNGSVPNFYGGLYEANSNILDIPMN